MKFTTIYLFIFTYLILFATLIMGTKENDDKKGKKPNRYNLLIKSRRHTNLLDQLVNRQKY